MTVTFDLKRLADNIRYRWGAYGITTYVDELYRRLERTDGVDVVPAIFADVDEAAFSTLELAATHLERSLRGPIACNWTRKASAPGLPGALRLLNHPRRGRSLLNPVTRALDRLAYVRTPFTRERQCDIYHSPVNPLPPVEWTGDSLRVLTVMDVIDLKRPELFPTGIAPIRKALDSVDVERDYVICASESARREILSVIPIREERTSVIHLAAKDLFDKPTLYSARERLARSGLIDGTFVLALAQDDPRKNLNALVDAFRKLRSSNNFGAHQLVLVAARKREQQLTETVEARGLPRSAFKILVDVDDATLAGLLALAAVFAYVPLYEGFGIPVVEAMKARCPVVVSSVSSLPEIAGDAGLYVDPTSVDGIAAGLQHVLGNEPLRESMKEEGRRRAERFSWDQTAAATVNFYRQIVNAQRDQIVRTRSASRAVRTVC